MLNFKGVPMQTWVRVIALFAILLNLIGVAFFDFKILPFEDEEIQSGVSIILAFIVSIWTGWKNNSFTTEAQLTDEQLKRFKNGEKGGL